MSAVSPHATRTDTIAGILRDEILSGQYRNGERLPSERDLSERFGASRGAVREALKQLQQLGIASIQPGGARVVPVTECTLDVLGPLLDLNDIPDPKLVDEVMHMVGVLMREAAAAAIDKATDDELHEAVRKVDEVLAVMDDPAALFEAMRKLGHFYVEVADHLVLRLMLNGLSTSFVDRMQEHRPMTTTEPDGLRSALERIRSALSQRKPKELSSAMRALNHLYRSLVRASLEQAISRRSGNPS